jgi:hypothetical protein
MTALDATLPVPPGKLPKNWTNKLTKKWIKIDRREFYRPLRVR